MSGAVHVAWALLAVAVLAGCAEQPLGTSRFPASATYTAQATEAGPGSDDVVKVTAEVIDCGEPKLVLGPACELGGTWGQGALVSMTGWSSGYRIGTLTLAAGQICLMPLGGGTAEEVKVTTGVVKVNEAHVADVSLAGEIASGTQKGRAVTFVFTAPAEGPGTACGR